MPKPKPILRGAFAPTKGLAIGSRMELYPDEIVWKRPLRTRRISLREVWRVNWSATQGSGPNFTLQLRSGELIEGKLMGAAQWTFKLKEMSREGSFQR